MAVCLWLSFLEVRPSVWEPPAISKFELVEMDRNKLFQFVEHGSGMSCSFGWLGNQQEHFNFHLKASYRFSSPHIGDV